MRILYIHGFGSVVNPKSEKNLALSRIGKLKAIAPDYTKGFDHVVDYVNKELDGIDYIVGTSMGGYLAAMVGTKESIPYCAINPAIKPSATLKRYIGSLVDYSGSDYTLTADDVASYPDVTFNDKGLVVLDMGDEVISSDDTLEYVKKIDGVTLLTYDGGSHRFDHIEEALPKIEMFYELFNPSSGFGDN